MTASTSEQLAKLMAGVELLMLDFDGPICSVFAGVPAPEVANRLRESLRRLGVEITAQLERDDDPLSIYRKGANYGPAVTAELFARLVAAEVGAIASAVPTPGAIDVVKAARATGLKTAVVSNNAAAAVESYLVEHDLEGLIDYVAARRSPEPRLMKPNPAYLIETATELGVPAARCVLVGDSVTDIEAARRAGVRAIGYANKPGKVARLMGAGAYALVTSMADIGRALANRPDEARGK
ncbi:HAD family hydrolase [Jiangella alkaliphila]|uniref:Haloacid dehalogenase superfamily, subfamily IA, variant 3 with third motif having DD or ED/haloacid dehalogenase superfamily, subfamily IA, variant 1 with third motif having Dx(3-4)D or Dx(3-4)E n=1 Tax=Jiangella alkaliphila TaxID=419479 RepID=A0A1H2IUI5_9ACTN|nr:HAD-IA family hydrolase [Jiangella alkaliphila]SDU47595.1 haloacid dehalogenase superfamily, subfamily IA, variant 3 with third motif having DD or ED/haloacid dehalogenase superfamily, subfamily IA, variant 1 with third motif having Dx(3-4)D or Dx(3-4)E [Jiangella alkaliphila]